MTTPRSTDPAVFGLADPALRFTVAADFILAAFLDTPAAILGAERPSALLADQHAAAAQSARRADQARAAQLAGKLAQAAAIDAAWAKLLEWAAARVPVPPGSVCGWCGRAITATVPDRHRSDRPYNAFDSDGFTEAAALRHLASPYVCPACGVARDTESPRALYVTQLPLTIRAARAISWSPDTGAAVHPPAWWTWPFGQAPALWASSLSSAKSSSTDQPLEPGRHARTATSPIDCPVAGPRPGARWPTSCPQPSVSPGRVKGRSPFGGRPNG